MAIEYELEEVLCLPQKIYEKEMDGYHIIVAPEYPNWIILNADEYEMFCYLKSGLSIRETLESYYKKVCQNEEVCLEIMTELLSQINGVDFRGDAEILEEDSIDAILKKIHIGTTNGCNMRCEHCFMAAGTKPLESINLEKTVHMIKELNDIYGKMEIVVSGGEPLTYQHLGELLCEIKENYVILFTNGSLISEKNIDVIAQCCNEVQVSFEGVSKEYYEKVRGSENYQKALHALDLLKSHGVRIVLAVTILPDTLEDIHANLINFVKKLNYSNLEVRLSDEIEMSGNALSMDMSNYRRDKSREIVIELVRKLKSMGCVVQGNDIRNIRFTNCGIGTNIVINYDGKVYPCHKLSEYSFELGTDVSKIIEEFNRINIETSNKYIPKCQKCELKYICSGGCRIDNLTKNENMKAVICDETYKDRQYRRLLNDFKMYREEKN